MRFLCLLTVLAACAAPARPTPPVSSSGIDHLRYRVGAHPHDVGAHLELARALAAAGSPGGALRHLQLVARNRTLGAADRTMLAELLAERARERVALADGGAIADVDRVRALKPHEPLPAGLERRALALAALAALRREDGRGAARWLDRLGTLAPDDARLAAADPAGASVNALGQAAWWAWHGGARRAALGLLERYWKEGGRDADFAELLARARYWWGGAAALDLLDRQAIAETGASLCAIAVSPDEPGCLGSLAGLVEDPATAHEIDRHAEAQHWRVRDGLQAAAWVQFALREHVSGHGRSWIAALSARVRPDALTGPPPRFAAATLRRLAGDGAGARRALDRALAEAARMTPGQRSVLVAEAAAQHRSSATIDRLLSQRVSTEGWVVALLDDRARGRKEARPALREAPRGAWRRALRASGALSVLAGAPGADRADRARAAHLHGAVAAFGKRKQLAPEAVVSLLARPFFADPDLSRIAGDFMRDPARADRTARAWADGAAAIGVRGPALAELFDRLGDPARALAWREQVARSSPEVSRYRLAVAIAAARVGDPDRALVELTLAANASGDAGPAYLAGARALLEAGSLPQALDAVRSAIGLLGPEEQLPALELARRATARLGRPDEVHRLQVAERKRLPADGRAPGADARAAALAGDDTAAALFPDDAVVAAAYARRLAAAGHGQAALAVVREASMRDPWNPAGPVAVLALAPPDNPAFVDAVRRLVALGMVARDRDNQRAALGALAQAVRRAGVSGGAATEPVSAAAGASGR